MSWNYRIIKRKLSEDEDSYSICEVHYNDFGTPISYAPDKNVLNQDSFKDLKWCHTEIAKAYKRSVLEDVNGKLVDLLVCPACGSDTVRGAVQISCTERETCGYTAVKYNSKKATIT